MSATIDRPRSSSRAGFGRRPPANHARPRSRREWPTRPLPPLVVPHPAAAASAEAAPAIAMAAVVEPLVALLAEAFALWQEIAVDSPAAILGDPAAGSKRDRAESGLAHADRLRRAAEACLGALGDRATAPVTEEPTVAAVSCADAGLTTREAEVLQLLADGHTDRQIAAVLFVSRRTVTSHVSSILGKLEAPSRTGAVARALRAGLI